jgi:hypothetical protein
MDDVTRREALRLAAAGAALAGAGAVASATEEKATQKPGGERAAEKTDVKHLEARVKELRDGVTKMAQGKDHEEFLRLIRRPGWTTPAEAALVSGILDAMVGQMKAMQDLHQALMAGARQVGAKG